MNLYFAPMEGITGYLFRNIHHECYSGISKYYIPYVEPHEKRAFNSRERNDIAREHNAGLIAVPQILTKDADGFLRMAHFLVSEGGYSEINLNLGCPSGTVVSKGKGAGFLAHTEELNRFLAQIFANRPCDISIKTRIGRFEPDEFEELLSIYNQYPVKELIVHPRTREDYYKYPARVSAYSYACQNTRLPLCYNGDIFSREDYIRLKERFPATRSWMLGRGMLINPQLAEMIEKGNSYDPARFIAFHDKIYAEYARIMPGGQPLLMKMKELWSYWFQNFPENKKLEKQLKKAKNRYEYEAAAYAFFSQQIFR